MDIGVLASAITTALLPLLPSLLGTKKSAGEIRDYVPAQVLEPAKSLWLKLKPKVDAKPAALEAAHDAAQMPDNEDARAALRWQFYKLLNEDHSLAEEASRWLEQSKATGNNVTAKGERSVAIGGDVTGSAIITGDRNIISDYGEETV